MIISIRWLLDWFGLECPDSGYVAYNDVIPLFSETFNLNVYENDRMHVIYFDRRSHPQSLLQSPSKPREWSHEHINNNNIANAFMKHYSNQKWNDETTKCLYVRGAIAIQYASVQDWMYVLYTYLYDELVSKC